MNAPKFLKSTRNRLIVFGLIVILYFIALIYLEKNKALINTILNQFFQPNVSNILIIAIPIGLAIVGSGIFLRIVASDFHDWLKSEDKSEQASNTNIDPIIESLINSIEKHYSKKMGEDIEFNVEVDTNNQNIFSEEHKDFVREKENEEIKVFPSKKIYARLKVDEYNEWRKEFRVRYPIIKGLKSESILYKINSIFNYEKVFDVSITESIEGDFWLNDLDYSIIFFKKPFLNMMFYMEGIGAYPWTVTQSVVVDYETGTLVEIKDILKEDSLERLASIINEFMQMDLKRAFLVESYLGEIPLFENKNHNESGQNNWLEERFGVEKFTAEALNEFTIDEDGISFIVHFGFPHVIKMLEPEGKYHFSFESIKQFIKPDSVLEKFIKENKVYY